MPSRNLTVLFVASLLAVLCYQRAARNRFADTFAQAMNIVTRDYVDEVEQRVLFEGAMNGMMDQLDMYSGYTPPREFRQFKEQIEGEFPGIGVMIELSDETHEIIVLAPLPGSPAAKAGIKARDAITAIGGRPTKDQPLEKALGQIKGPAGSTVQLTIRRPGHDGPLEFSVPRAKISIESVLGDARRDDGSWIYHLLGHPRIGYIRIDSFGERTADDLRRAFDTLRAPGEEVQALILDLRGNEGGLLNAAVETCDMLLDDGLIVSTRGRGGVERASYRAEPGTDLDPDLPLVVLVDRYSASASEIVAACLQDHGRAVIVGERSWGKGTVQNVEELEGGNSAIRLTIATYWRPSGKDIHKRRTSSDADDWGVRPDEGLEVKLTKPQYQELALVRRTRDLAPLEELRKASAERGARSGEPKTDPVGPPVPLPDPGEDDAASAPLVDPQLHKAIEYLEGLLGQRSRQPRAA